MLDGLLQSTLKISAGTHHSTSWIPIKIRKTDCNSNLMLSLDKQLNSDSRLRNTLFFLGIALIIFFLRTIYTTEPEMHDVRKKWVVAGEIANTNDFSHIVSHDHHSSRWGVILPTALAIKLNGKNLITYLCLLLAIYGFIFASLIKFANSVKSPIFTSLDANFISDAKMNP